MYTRGSRSPVHSLNERNSGASSVSLQPKRIGTYVYVPKPEPKPKQKPARAYIYWCLSGADT